MKSSIRLHTHMTYKLIDHRPSQYSQYIIAVVDTFISGMGYRHMMELKDINELENVSYVFSSSFLSPVLMNKQPLGYAAVAIDIIIARVDSTDDHIVIAGLGSGTTHSILSNRLNDIQITSIESDQTVIDLAKEYWDFSGDVIHDTVECCLSKIRDNSLKTFYLNVYCEEANLNSETISKNLTWLNKCLTKIKPNGFLLINTYIDGSKADKHYLYDYAEENNLNISIVEYDQNTFTILTKPLT